MTAAATVDVSYKDIARRLKISPAAVSRYLRGTRIPKLAIQVKIEKLYGWPITEQATAASRGKYPAEFEKAMKRAASVASSTV